MATIASETFEGGSNGATITTGNTFFTSVSPTNPGLFVNDPYEGALAFTPVVNNISINRRDITATATLWLSFYLKLTTDTTSSTAFLTFYDGDSNKIADVRIQAGRLLQLRSVNTSRWVSTALALGEWHRIAVQVAPTAGGTGTLRLKVYSGAGRDGATATQDSGAQTASAAAATVSNFRFGTASADATFDYRLDRVLADNAAEPAGLVTITAPDVSAAASPSSVVVGGTITLDGTLVSNGGATTTYAWTKLSGPGTATIASATSLDTTCTVNAAGSYVFRLTATNSAGSDTADTTTITVTAANTAPTANAGADQTGVAPYATVTLNGSGSTDPESQALTYAWAQTAGTPTVSLSGSGASRTFTAPATVAGTTLTFGLTVTDSGGLSSTQDTMAVQVVAHNRFVVAPNGTDRIGVRSSRVT